MPKSTLRRIIDEIPGASVTTTTTRSGSSAGGGFGVLHALDVLFTAYRGIVAGNVQRAIEMLEDRKLNVSGGTMSGALYLAGDPSDDDEAASRHYVDTYMTDGRGAVEVAVNSLANVPLFHVTHESETGRLGVPTAPGIDWTPAGVRISPAILNYAEYESVTGTHTAADKPVIYCDGTFTVNLPAAAIAAGRVYHVVNVGTGTVTVDGSGSETINGATTLSLAHQYDSAALHCNGTGWYLI
jgi:hypothetical protein